MLEHLSIFHISASSFCFHGNYWFTLTHKEFLQANTWRKSNTDEFHVFWGLKSFCPWKAVRSSQRTFWASVYSTVLWALLKISCWTPKLLIPTIQFNKHLFIEGLLCARHGPRQSMQYWPQGNQYLSAMKFFITLGDRTLLFTTLFLTSSMRPVTE